MNCHPGEKLEREEVDVLIKECCDPEDEDGFVPYERELLSFVTDLSMMAFFHLFFNICSILEKGVCRTIPRDVRRLVKKFLPSKKTQQQNTLFTPHLPISIQQEQQQLQQHPLLCQLGFFESRK